MRGAGGPSILRTGQPGRPRKRFNMVQGELAECAQDYGNVAEISVKEALSGCHADQWQRAIQDEFKALIRNGTCDLVDRPENKNIIGCRIVLTNKYKNDRTIERRKAPLFAKGYSQQPGVDFNETFAPVARLGSIRLVMAVAVEARLVVHQLDVTTAFLNGTVEEDIYILPKIAAEQNQGNAVNMMQAIQKGEKVCHLRKAIYGLKQAGR